MTAQIIDGKALADELRQSFKARVEALAAKGNAMRELALDQYRDQNLNQRHPRTS